jgi:2-haloacid dehalogenase
MHLTFDCYGTLIDWESGILTALRPMLAVHQVHPSDDEILTAYGRLETEAEHGPFRPYREILADVVRGFGKEYGFAPSESEITSLAESVRNWPAFPDTVAALRRLGEKHQLVILSNIDQDLVQGSLEHLEVPFFAVITAEEIGSYKPSLNNFRYLLEKLDVPKSEILHCAQSLFHDIAPANEIGLKTVWVNRRKGKSGSGATPPATATPDFEIGNLRELANMEFE